jgi:hypothetical protein
VLQQDRLGICVRMFLRIALCLVELTPDLLKASCRAAACAFVGVPCKLLGLTLETPDFLIDADQFGAGALCRPAGLIVMETCVIKFTHCHSPDLATARRRVRP